MKNRTSAKYEDRYVEIGLNISYYRKKNKISQLDLAEMTGLSRTFISNIEAPNTVCAISLDSLFSIADALEVEPYLLLKEH